MTFSVVARCAQTGMFGMAVSSSSPAVAARCAHARAGVGVAASQNVTDPVLGARALELLSLGLGAQAVVDALVASTPHHAYRQLAVVDACGATAAYSGDQTLGVYATAHGRNVVCSGNLLANESVPREMVLAFEAAEGALGDRVMASLKSGLAAGGEAGPVRSAGLLLVREVSWPVAGLAS